MEYFLLSLGFGFLSLLTPCVFPLIPMTVSYFTKKQETENFNVWKEASIFVLGIVITFTLVGLLVASVFGASGINNLATNPYLNLFVALLFILFAFNLMGAFEIIIPSSILTSLTNAQTGSGILSTLLMSFTFTLTTFTCTMPFIGSVLVSASRGEWFYPLIGMLGYSIAFSLPFFLLAVSPSLLKKLPRSGNWMLSFKIVLGMLELAAALKFISNADLVLQTQLLPREFFLIIWASIFFAISLYLFGVYRFSHESASAEGKHPVRILLAILFLSFALNFTFSTNGRRLGEFEAFLPPYSSEGAITSKAETEELVWFDNLEKAKEKALIQNRRIFIDFTGYTCTNCRWMEQNIFVIPEVKTLLNKFVLVRLYTDGDEKVHEDNQKYQEDKFGTIALPLYAGLNTEDKILGQFMGMTRDKNEFSKFLESLLKAE